LSREKYIELWGQLPMVADEFLDHLPKAPDGTEWMLVRHYENNRRMMRITLLKGGDSAFPGSWNDIQELDDQHSWHRGLRAAAREILRRRRTYLSEARTEREKLIEFASEAINDFYSDLDIGDASNAIMLLISLTGLEALYDQDGHVTLRERK